jgi:hypothetical protein
VTKPKEAQPVVATCRQQVAALGQTSPAKADFREKALEENKRRAVERARRVLELEERCSPALSRLESIAVDLDTPCLADPCVEHSHARLYVEYAILVLRKKRAPPDAPHV